MGNPQTVLVTGAAQGIGFGIGKCFAMKGARVVAADVNAQKAEEAAEAFKKYGAADAFGVRCDVTQRPEIEAVAAECNKRFGGIDVLVNNAGICPFVHIMEMSPEMWQRTIDVNLTGVFNCTQIVAKHMIERGKGGRIIFITSLAENVTGPHQVDYGASKAGARMTMAGFAAALGPHKITCNAIAPGMILTPLTASHWEKPENAEAIKHRVPMGRIGSPDDIGKAAVFLASDDAEYVSGITLRVDGGHQVVCV